MASVLIVAGGTGRAASRASVLAIAVAAPAAIFEAVVGIGVTGIPAKAARCASAMLGIRVIFPTSVFQGMALRGAGADVRITDAAMLFHGVLRIVVLIILRACAVATVLIFSTSAAIVALAVAVGIYMVGIFISSRFAYGTGLRALMLGIAYA